MLLNNFRNVSQTISFSTSITLVTHVESSIHHVPQHLFQLYEIKASLFWETPKPVLYTAWQGIRSGVEKLFETLEPEDSHKHHQPVILPNPVASVVFGPLQFNTLFRESP